MTRKFTLYFLVWKILESHVYFIENYKNNSICPQISNSCKCLSLFISFAFYLVIETGMNVIHSLFLNWLKSDILMAPWTKGIFEGVQKLKLDLMTSTKRASHFDPLNYGDNQISHENDSQRDWAFIYLSTMKTTFPPFDHFHFHNQHPHMISF